MAQDRPKIGIGVIVHRDGKILVGRRLAAHGAGNWQIPGGHLEFGESLEESAMREAAEETGVADLTPVGVISISNDIMYDKHYLTIGVLVESKQGEPTDPESDKSTDWHWCDPKELPQPMLPYSETAVVNWLNGTVYSQRIELKD